MDGPTIEIDDLWFRYTEQDHWLLSGLNLRLYAGEFVAIQGPSGVGKSTLLNLIALLAKPDKGRITLLNQEVSSFSESVATRWRRQHLGFVFQQFHLLPHLTVEENIQLPLVLNRLESSSEYLEDVLHNLGLYEFRHRYPRHLSGGQMQRVAIGRALIHQPSILLADEPTGNLDAMRSEEAMAMLAAQIKLRQTTAVMVTHSDFAAAHADKVYKFENQKFELA